MELDIELTMNRNVDTKPSNIRIGLGEKVEFVMSMENGYIMIKYKGGFYPIPKDSIKEQDKIKEV